MLELCPLSLHIQRVALAETADGVVVVQGFDQLGVVEALGVVPRRAVVGRAEHVA